MTTVRSDRWRRAAVVTATVGLALSGCGGGGGEPVSRLETPDDGSVIRFAKSGGIAGVVESLTLRDDGTGSITVGFRGEARDVRISRERFAQLRALLEDAGFAELDSATPNEDARDLFMYAYGFAGETVTDETDALVDELDDARSELESIIAGTE